MDSAEEDFFINANGKKLFRLTYKQKTEDLKGFVFLCHGLFEHSRSSYFDLIIKPLTELGCIVVAHDHIGHGHSEGERGRVDKMDLLVQDVLDDIVDCRARLKLTKSVPLIVYGHSLGGLIATTAALQPNTDINCLVLEAPALQFPDSVMRVTIWAARLAAWIIPNFVMGSIKYDEMSRNTEYLERLRSDELYHHAGVTASTGLAILMAVEKVRADLTQLTVPVLIGHGSNDTITPLAGSRFLMKMATKLVEPTEKRLVLFEGARHQLRNETEGVPQAWSTAVADWVSGRI